MELNCIRLLVENFDNCFRFYTEKLGLTATWGKLGETYASFDVGMPWGLSIFNSNAMASAIGNIDKPLPLDCREKSVIVLKVDNVDEIFTQLSKRGVMFINQPTDMPGWGIRVVHLRDPENNLLELFTELPKDKWDDDLLEDSNKYKK